MRFVWFCCQCGAGPNEVDYAPHCQECYYPHARCESCKVVSAGNKTEYGVQANKHSPRISVSTAYNRLPSSRIRESPSSKHNTRDSPSITSDTPLSSSLTQNATPNFEIRHSASMLSDTPLPSLNLRKNTTSTINTRNSPPTISDTHIPSLNAKINTAPEYYAPDRGSVESPRDPDYPRSPGNGRECIITDAKPEGGGFEKIQEEYSNSLVDYSSLESENKDGSQYGSLPETLKNFSLRGSESSVDDLGVNIVRREAHPVFCPTDQKWSQISLFMSMENKLKRLLRPRLGAYMQRIEWTCRYGHELYADFSSSAIEEIDRLSSILQSAGTQPSQVSESRGMNTLSDIQSRPQASPPDKILSSTSTRSNSGFGVSTAARPVSRASSLASQGTSSQIYLELCINTGEYTKTLSEIDLRDVSCDGELFKKNTKRPSGLHFVKFSIQDPLRVGILQKPLSIPPKEEVDSKRYTYSPCPLVDDPPIPTDIFLHYLYCPSLDPSPAWLPRLPKKLGPSILRFKGAINEGWGIHINEGPNWFALGIVNIGMMIMSGVAAGLWKYFTDDFQGAFGFAGWIVAVVNAALFAYVAKWKDA